VPVRQDRVGGPREPRPSDDLPVVIIDRMPTPILKNAANASHSLINTRGTIPRNFVLQLNAVNRIGAHAGMRRCRCLYRQRSVAAES
jgi:hypothetical protein